MRDRRSRAELALKVLAEDATEREMAALVREAVALSGLEGLGVPRVVAFGRLPGSGRPYMLRELVQGESLEGLLATDPDAATLLAALAGAAEQLTVVHRSGLLHGDVKPANIIVEPGGRSTLVDLGLAAPWRDAGTTAEGLTPRYAAPELLSGGPLTVRAEVYALGATLDQLLRALPARAVPKPQRTELGRVAARALHQDPGERHPSADEFAVALRRAAGLPPRAEDAERGTLWPIVGAERAAALLLDAVLKLTDGGALLVVGAHGSGKSALIRRVAWSLGVQGQRELLLDRSTHAEVATLDAELEAEAPLAGVTLLVDDAEGLSAAARGRLTAARAAGARLVHVGGEKPAPEAATFSVPPIDEHAATELVRRAMPSLTDRLLARVVQAAAGSPGVLRRIVARLAAGTVASEEDVDRAASDDVAPRTSLPPSDPLERALFALDRGRFDAARSALEAVRDGDPLSVAVAWARVELGVGDAGRALSRLTAVEPLAAAQRDKAAGQAWRLVLGRAHLGLGDYARALELTDGVANPDSALGAEALTYHGLARAFLGQPEQAETEIESAVASARAHGFARVEAVALASLGLAHQRADRLDAAREAYERTIEVAERAGEAGTLATAQLNLAGLLKVGGDIAAAIRHFEAAVDLGQRSGRLSVVRSAWLNLANTDLYLGRVARARSSIEALAAQRPELSPGARAQLLGLEAELAARSADPAQAARLYVACADAYDALGRGVDAAEAVLEGVLLGARAAQPDLPELRAWLDRARAALGDSGAHRSLSELAAARVHELAGDEGASRAALERALGDARSTGQREWEWRSLEARAGLSLAAGQPLLARRDREEALAVLEAIGARLPRDLREVYWNDPRRRALREGVHALLATATTEHVPFDRAQATQSSAVSTLSGFVAPLAETTLARILEVNADLAGLSDVDRLAQRITDHAVDLLRAERGFVLLLQPDGSLTTHTSRARLGHDPHLEFSHGVAESVIKTGEPVVSLSARDDTRMSGYASVHQLMLQSIACVPIRAPSGAAIGALYVETRLKPARHFERDLPTLRALADQVAIAIENARLIDENRRRADALALANQQLQGAQERLQELLGDRTEQLKRTRKKLRETRETLHAHFGYHGLVGTSDAMRRVYALIDRVKDTDVPVLITGESGTGKEVVARAIHTASERKQGKFLGVNCGAIPENLLESELFGSIKGSFTGADRDRKGLIREGEGGSVLLDEIGEMPHKMQAGLLRVLQERRVRPVGGAEEEPVDVRMMFATHRNLEELVRNHKFREDLYYRINVVEVALPPLRARVEDIPQLVDHFLGIFAARYKREKHTVSRDALRRLASYGWPGNVRQLEHVLLNAWVLSEQPELTPEDFTLPGTTDARLASQSAPATPARRDASDHAPKSSTRAPREPPPVAERRAAKSTISQHHRDERERILGALASCNWNRVKAAELSGIPRRTFYRRMKEYGIQ